MRDALGDESAVPVAVHRVFDLDDVGAPVGEERARDGHEHELRQLDDPDPSEEVDGRFGHGRDGTAGVNRNSFSALPRWILYWVSAGRSASNFLATPMQSGHVVSLCG